MYSTSTTEFSFWISDDQAPVACFSVERSEIRDPSTTKEAWFYQQLHRGLDLMDCWEIFKEEALKHLQFEITDNLKPKWIDNEGLIARWAVKEFLEEEHEEELPPVVEIVAEEPEKPAEPRGQTQGQIDFFEKKAQQQIEKTQEFLALLEKNQLFYKFWGPASGFPESVEDAEQRLNVAKAKNDPVRIAVISRVVEIMKAGGSIIPIKTEKSTKTVFAKSAKTSKELPSDFSEKQSLDGFSKFQQAFITARYVMTKENRTNENASMSGKEIYGLAKEEFLDLAFDNESSYMSYLSVLGKDLSTKIRCAGRRKGFYLNVEES